MRTCRIFTFQTCRTNRNEERKFSLTEDEPSNWEKLALRAEAQLKIAMEALNTIGFSLLDCMNRCCRSEAKKAIAKINALETEGRE